MANGNGVILKKMKCCARVQAAETLFRWMSDGGYLTREQIQRGNNISDRYVRRMNSLLDQAEGASRADEDGNGPGE